MTKKNIIFFTDFHAHDFTEFSKPNAENISDRFQEQLDVLEQVFTIAREKSADVVFGGDLFHKRGAVDVRIFNRVFNVIGSNPDIRTILVRGNHDSYTNSLDTDSSLDTFQSLPNVEVITSPRSIEMGSYTLHGLPYGDEVVEMKTWINNTVATMKDTKNILVAHIGVDGATTGKGSHRLEGAFSVADLHTDKFDYVLLGHYHKRQELTANCVYGGNTIQTSFSDEGQDKGVYFLDLQGADIISTFIPIESRKFITIEGNDIPENIEEIMENNFVRFIGNQKQLKVIEKLKKDDSIDFTNMRVMMEKDYTVKMDINIEPSSTPDAVVTAYADKFYPTAKKVALECLKEATLLED